MRHWNFGAGERDDADPDPPSRTGEVQEPGDSRRFLEEEDRLLAARKRAAGSAEPQRTGLALSGGGIRSAALAFGVIQVFEERDLMRHVDYLSTVSGGGYTGGAYSAWRLRRAQHAAGANGTGDDQGPRVGEAPPAQWRELLPHLYNFSNYIAPRVGLASEGAWRIVSTMARNLTVHWLALVAAIVLAFALALLTLRFLWALSLVFAAVGLALIARGVYQEYRARRYFAECGDERRKRTRPCGELLLEVQRLLQEPRVPLFIGLGFYALAAALWFVSTTQPVFPRRFGVAARAPDVTPAWMLPQDWGPWAERLSAALGSGLAVAVVIVAVSAALVVAVGFVSEWRWRPRRNFWPKPSWIGLLFVLALVFVTWFGLAIGNGYFRSVSSESVTVAELFTRSSVWSIASAWDYVWQTALVLGLFALLAGIIVAVLNQEMDRVEREWATRIVSVSLATSAAWLVLPGLALASSKLAGVVAFGPDVSVGAVLSGLGLSGAWLTISGWAARLGQTESAVTIMGKYWKRVLVAAGPAVFAVGLVVLVCFAAALTLMLLAQTLPAVAEVPAAHRATAVLWSGWYTFGLLIAAGVVFAIAGVILDPNEFSLHGFYRDRLVRCFLGASNVDTPAPDSLWNLRADDLPLAATVAAVREHGAPFHVINTAVNLFNSKDLRVQRRRSDSFVLTPLCCGSRTTAYAPMPAGLHLGTAMAISGAAVSTHTGLYTRDPALAALLTFFNLRMGYWFGNPRKGVPARRKRPLFAPQYLFAEAFALTNEERDFVHLSDGGHFDNLGVYEMLRRRCRYVIAVDAECDAAYRCSALAWLVRTARIDFGIEIGIDIEHIADLSGPHPRAASHWLLGTIRYPPAGDEAAEYGWLLYIKSSLLADGKNSHVGADVLEYAKANPDFPHESSTDQFFSESQFESYRMLGECIARTIVPEGPADLAGLFRQLQASTADAAEDAGLRAEAPTRAD